MNRAKTILGYAFVTTFCGCLALVASQFIFQTDYRQAGSCITFADKIICAAAAVTLFSLVLAFTALYDRYKLYKSFYHSMVRRIEKIKIL
jgi:hypothetical protein